MRQSVAARAAGQPRPSPHSCNTGPVRQLISSSERGMVQKSVTEEPVLPAASRAGQKKSQPSAEEQTPKEKRLNFLKESAIIVVSALICSWLIKTLLVQAFFIPSQSMMDTLEIGDRVMVSRLVPRFQDVRRGDVVVFTDPGNWLDPYVPPDRGPVLNAVTRLFTLVGLIPQDSGEHLVKRVIGLPGDNVACCDVNGRVLINGVAIDEPYLKPGVEPSETYFGVDVPEGMLFVLGDNRSDSADSRYNMDKPYGGFVPIENVVGSTFARVWPLDRAALVRNPAYVYADLPAATGAGQ